jgi:hypothetical protein
LSTTSPAEQKHGVTTAVARKLKRRSTVEPVIGHMESEHRVDRNQTLVFSYGRRER